MFQISIPKELIEPLARTTYGERSAVCTMLALKAIDDSGVHAMRKSGKRGYRGTKRQLNIEQRDKLMEILLLSAKQIENHINKWVEMKIAEFGEDGHLRVASYDEICKYFGVEKTRSTVRIKPTARKLHYIIEKLAIEYEIKRQKEQYKNNLRFVAKAWKATELVECQKKNGTKFLWDWQLQLLRSGKRLDEMNDAEFMLMQYRADFNMNFGTIRERLGYSDRATGSVAHLKRRLAKAGLVFFMHRKETINSQHYTTKRQREHGLAAKFGRVFHEEGQKQGEITLFLCDEAQFFNHNEEMPKNWGKLGEYLNEKSKINAAN